MRIGYICSVVKYEWSGFFVVVNLSVKFFNHFHIKFRIMDNHLTVTVKSEDLIFYNYIISVTVESKAMLRTH